MQQSSTAFLIFALVIVVNQIGATEHFYNYEEKTDQLAQEAKHRAVTILDGPKYVASSTPAPAPPANNTQADKRPPSKPPNAAPIKHGKPKYVDLPRLYIGPLQNLQHSVNPYSKQPPNSVYKYHKVIPLQKSPHRNTIYPKQQHLVFAASTSKPTMVAKSPKFSLPVETINGIRSDFVRPPHFINHTTSSTTTTPTTTTKYLRTKRIWPKHILDKLKSSNTSESYYTETKNNTSENDLNSEGSHHKIIFITDKDTSVSTARPTRGSYRPVTRVPKKKPSTPAPADFTHVEPNDWVPIIPSHYTVKKVRKSKQTPISRRSDRSEVYLVDPKESPNYNKRLMYLQSFGLIPVAGSTTSTNPNEAATAARKNIIYVGKTKQLKPHVYSGYRGKPGVHTTHINGDYLTDESSPPKILTKIKHHHHHHHHRYIKTVDKPVRVEVPKPVPVPVPMPVPVKVEHRVPYPVPVKVPHPVPVKVIEKEYVPKPYPVVQQVPVVKHVEVKVPQPYPVEKRVPYPVQVEVPVPKPYPVPVPVEKRVPVPYPVRVLVPQPYPVETKVPVPVKEPVEVIKHVPVRVAVPKPYPVRVPVPVPYETKVPYPVEVEKKVPLPMPFRVLVPEKVEIEKKVPVYIPKPYPVEKKVPVPVKVPYPVKVPVRVPVGVPIFMHPTNDNSNGNSERVVSGALTVGADNQFHSHYSYAVNGNTVTSSPQQTVPVQGNIGSFGTDVPHETVTFHGNTVTSGPHQTVTFHGNIGHVNGFQSRSDVVDESTTPYITSTSTKGTELGTFENQTSWQPVTEQSSEATTTSNAIEPR